MKKESENKSPEKRELLVIRDFEGIEAIRHTWEKLHAEESYPRINADIDRYLATLKARGETVEPYIIVLKENGLPVTMLIGMIDKNHIKCTVGRWTLFKPELMRLFVVYNGIIGSQTEQTCNALVAELLNELRSGRIDVVYFNCLETGSSIFRAARKIPGFLSRCHSPKTEIHWRMTLPKDIGSFYKSLSGKHASNLRRLINKLEREYQDKVQVITYRNYTELDTAIKAVSKISATTYQHAYGLGVVDDSRTRMVLSEAAKLGRLQIDILYIDDEPAAFQLAMKYGNTYFGEKIGFNPKWEKYRIGTILYLKVTEALCADPSVKYYDFGFGDTQYKRNYCDTQWAEAHVYIFARRFFPVLLNMILSVTSAVSVLANKFVTMLGIRNAIQRYRHKKILEKTRREKGNPEPRA